MRTRPVEDDTLTNVKGDQIGFPDEVALEFGFLLWVRSVVLATVTLCQGMSS